MKVLVLGSTGLVGTAITQVCDLGGIKCVALSHSDVDIRNPTSLMVVLREYEPTVVVNAAGVVGINACEEDPLKAVNINVNSVCYLADLCNKLSIILVQPSTHNVFDGTKDGYYTEDDLPRPIQIYGITRYLSEKVVARYDRHYVVRYPTLFGKRTNNKSAFPDKVIDWIKEGREFNISYDKIDSPSYGLDVAKVTIDIVKQGLPFGTYHVANSGATNYYSFVQEISDVLGIKANVTKVKEATFEVRAPNALKTAMTSIKLQPLRSWQEALKGYLNGH